MSNLHCSPNSFNDRDQPRSVRPHSLNAHRLPPRLFSSPADTPERERETNPTQDPSPSPGSPGPIDKVIENLSKGINFTWVAIAGQVTGGALMTALDIGQGRFDAPFMLIGAIVTKLSLDVSFLPLREKLQEMRAANIPLPPPTQKSLQPSGPELLSMGSLIVATPLNFLSTILKIASEAPLTGACQLFQSVGLGCMLLGMCCRIRFRDRVNGL